MNETELKDKFLVVQTTDETAYKKGICEEINKEFLTLRTFKNRYMIPRNNINWIKIKRGDIIGEIDKKDNGEYRPGNFGNEHNNIRVYAND